MTTTMATITDPSSAQDGRDERHGGEPAGGACTGFHRRSRLTGGSPDTPEDQLPASSTARAKTASSIGSVSRPVNVFCWLGW